MGPVAVLDPVARLAQVAVTAVDHEVRLRSDGSAEADELVRPERVGVRGVPGRVRADGPAVARPDPVPPAVGGDEVAAGVADVRVPQAARRLDDVDPQAVEARATGSGIIDAPVD